MNKTFRWLCLLLLLFFFTTNIFGQYCTRALQENIKTVQVSLVSSNKFTIPILELNSDEKIRVSFDELSPDIHNLYYSVQHCNADWTPSSISSIATRAVDPSSSATAKSSMPKSAGYPAQTQSTACFPGPKVNSPSSSNRSDATMSSTHRWRLC